jgi:hypothetical protein
MQELAVTLDRVKGHKEFMDTACPGVQWLQEKKWKQMLYQEIALVQREAAEAGPTPTDDAKPLFHYMLFWASNVSWAEKDWLGARQYVGAFRPTVGFSINDAALAKYVTIVGGPLGVPQKAEEQLLASGCKVERIAGKDERETQSILNALVRAGKRFYKLEESPADTDRD